MHYIHRNVYEYHNEPTLHLLILFDALYRCGSVSVAADENLPQLVRIKSWFISA